MEINLELCIAKFSPIVTSNIPQSFQNGFLMVWSDLEQRKALKTIFYLFLVKHFLKGSQATCQSENKF